MSEAPKIKVLTILVAVLILLNIGTLGYIWYSRSRADHGPRDGRGPGGLVIKELQFDAKQQEAFERLRNEHHEAMKKIGEENRQLHDELFRSLGRGSDASTYADSLIHRIAMLRIENEQITYRHLAQVRQLCTPQQQQRFDAMIAEAMAQRDRDQGPPPPEQR